MKPHDKLKVAIAEYIAEVEQTGKSPEECDFSKEEMAVVAKWAVTLRLQEMIQSAKTLLSSMRPMGSSGIQSAVLTSALKDLESAVEKSVETLR